MLASMTAIAPVGRPSNGTTDTQMSSSSLDCAIHFHVSSSIFLNVDAISTASFQAFSARAMRSARPFAGQCLRMNAATFGLVLATEFIDGAEAFVTFARFLRGEEECFGRSPLMLSSLPPNWRSLHEGERSCRGTFSPARKLVTDFQSPATATGASA